MSEEQIQQFKKAAEPLVKFLNENCNPHTIAIVSVADAELLSGEAMVKIDHFISD